MFKITKKRMLTALSVIGVLAISVAAFAYWTTSGSGSGSATAGTNSSSTQAQQVSNLHVAISIDPTHATAGCLASWFTYKADSQASGDSNPHTVALNTEIAASGTHAV